jgi:hypothetical protein
VIALSKLISVSVTLACIFAIAGTLFEPQANASTNYYSNNFDSASTLNDGYWSLHDAGIQTIGGSDVLAVNGEATFMPQHGSYAFDNFTVQFDVFHNIVYGNNSAFQGPFYVATDSNGNSIINMGIYQRQMNNIDLAAVGGLDFSNTTTGQSSHYYFLLDSSGWSTWRLTVTTALTEGRYLANVTLQINDETITSFATGLPRPDGMGEMWVSNITNEHVLNPIAYQNLLPLPMAGVTVPTYTPTAKIVGGVHYDLMSNIKSEPMAFSQATTSYVDNFYYGYANTEFLSSTPTTTPTPTEYQGNEVSPTPTPTPTATVNPTINSGALQPQAQSFPTILVAALVVSVVVVIAGVLIFLRKSKRKLS